MAVETESINIPARSVSGMTDLLTTIYSNAVRRGVSFKKIPTPMLWGAPGIGKSRGVYQLAHRLERDTGKRVNVIDVRLLLFSPIDLRGIPVADADRILTNWLKPGIFDMDGDEGIINILFLDELSAAPQQVQAAAYQICLDRKVGEHVLPDNCVVIAAGNRTTDQSVSYKMPKALCNRLMHYNVESDYEAWRKWAVNNGINDKLIAFLGANNSRLCIDPAGSDLAYPTPRSWEFVSTLMDTMGGDADGLYAAIGACVGMDTALELKAFSEGLYRLPDVNDILAGKCTDYPKTPDAIMALISEITAKVKARGSSVSVETLNKIWVYASRLPKDYALVLMKDFSAIDSINKMMMQCSAFQNWLLKSKFKI